MFIYSYIKPVQLSSSLEGHLDPREVPNPIIVTHVHPRTCRARCPFMTSTRAQNLIARPNKSAA
jgi:hypothetical protein